MPPRPALPMDLPALVAFLEQRIESSMFLLGNLAEHGLGTSPHPHAMTVWLQTDAAGVCGALGLTRSGIVLMQLPPGADTAVWARCLRGAEITGLNGDAAQVAALAAALGMGRARFGLWSEQPLMTLDLSALRGPFAAIRAPTEGDLPLLTDWMAAYGVETGTAEAATAPARAQAALARGETRLLIDAGAPVAMSSLNARAGQAVQVGGVYTPPEGRGRGRAGRLVTAQLAEQRARGVNRAVLFAASPVAEGAYRKIGFAETGRYGVALLPAPFRIAA